MQDNDIADKGVICQKNAKDLFLQFFALHHQVEMLA